MDESQSQFITLTEEQFRDQFLKAAHGNLSDADDFFNQFLFVQELFRGHYSKALEYGISLLDKCRLTDEKAYRIIHKGTPFYWLGTAAFLSHDHETAVFFYDAAVSEDLRAGADPKKQSSPSLRFIQVEGEFQAQAARPLVLATQERIEEALADYNKRPGKSVTARNLSLQDVRTQFLSLAVSPGYERWRSLATTFISFFIEWDYRSTLLNLSTGTGTTEPFFIHLFKGCVLFESLLKGNPKHNVPANKTTLGLVIQHLHRELYLPNNIKIGGADFPTILNGLANANDSIQTAFEFTGKIRNTVGHNLGWVVQMNGEQYQRLFRMITSACLHAIACCYC